MRVNYRSLIGLHKSSHITIHKQINTPVPLSFHKTRHTNTNTNTPTNTDNHADFRQDTYWVRNLCNATPYLPLQPLFFFERHNLFFLL